MFSFILRVNIITEGCMNDMEKHFCQLSSIHQWEEVNILLDKGRASAGLLLPVSHPSQGHGPVLPAPTSHLTAVLPASLPVSWLFTQQAMYSPRYSIPAKCKV